MAHGQIKKVEGAEAEAVLGLSGEWSTIQAEIRDAEPEVEQEISSVLAETLGRVRMRKALRAHGLPASAARGAA